MVDVSHCVRVSSNFNALILRNQDHSGYDRKWYPGRVLLIFLDCDQVVVVSHQLVSVGDPSLGMCWM